MSQRVKAYTPQTIIDVQARSTASAPTVRKRFSMSNEELERGLRAIAVPVLDRSGQAVGAMDLSNALDTNDA